MLLSFVLLLVGFVLLIFGADKLVEGASAIAKKLNVPDIVIGLTIVAFGTSAPELVVNSFAAFKGSGGIILGNIIGSNIFNTLAIVGVCALIYPLTVQKDTLWKEIPFSLLAALVALVLANGVLLNGESENWFRTSQGFILIGFFLVFISYNIFTALSGSANNDEVVDEIPVWKSLLFIVGGFAGLVFGGKLIVDNAVSIAQSFGMSERVIGLTVISIGTSLPELATSIIAVRKKNFDVAIGNVVGSNIFNIFLILGVSSLVGSFQVPQGANFDLFVNILASVLLFAFILISPKRYFEKWAGFIFLAGYVGYVTFLINKG